MRKVRVLGLAFLFRSMVNQQIEPVEFRIILDQGFDLLVVGGDQIRGGCQEIFHEFQFLFTKTGFGQDHEFTSIVTDSLRRDALPIIRFS